MTNPIASDIEYLHLQDRVRQKGVQAMRPRELATAVSARMQSVRGHLRRGSCATARLFRQGRTIVSRCLNSEKVREGVNVFYGVLLVLAICAAAWGVLIAASVP